MNPQKLSFSPDQDEAEYRWFHRICDFFVSVFGSEVSHEQSIAIMDIITMHSIRLRDGFVINDQTDINRDIWRVDAAVIASALCSTPDKDYIWWKVEFSSFDKSARSYVDLKEHMLATIQASPALLAIDTI